MAITHFVNTDHYSGFGWELMFHFETLWVVVLFQNGTLKKFIEQVKSQHNMTSALRLWILNYRDLNDEKIN